MDAGESESVALTKIAPVVWPANTVVVAGLGVGALGAVFMSVMFTVTVVTAEHNEGVPPSQACKPNVHDGKGSSANAL